VGVSNVGGKSGRIGGGENVSRDSRPLPAEGASYYPEEPERTGQDDGAVHAARMRLVGEAYLAFRAKGGDPALPPAYAGRGAFDFGRLRQAEPPPCNLYQPPLAIAAQRSELA
jgi:hypothetical protein